MKFNIIIILCWAARDHAETKQISLKQLQGIKKLENVQTEAP